MSLPPTINNALFQNKAHQKAAFDTLSAIDKVISEADLTLLSNRPITEVEALKQEVAAVVPVGNIVGLITSGLLRLRGRTIPIEQAKSDINALLRGLDVLPGRLMVGTFVAGPAAVLAAYQKLLKLTGKNLDSAFPEGLWQFYLEFALREDSARHANETIGFQQALEKHGFDLSTADQLAAWVCAASQICFQYDDLLANEWHEQTSLNLLQIAAEAAGLDEKLYFQRLHGAWTTQRPYHRGRDVGTNEDYDQYRRRRFDNFFQKRFQFLPEAQQDAFQTTYNERRDEELSAYQEQMTILATLDPERYRETRRPVPLWQARIGLVFQGRYYLLPVCHTDRAGRPILSKTRTKSTTGIGLLLRDNQVCDPYGRALGVDRRGCVYNVEDNQQRGYLQPIQFQAVRRLVAAILAQSDPMVDSSNLTEQLIAIPRTSQEQARKMLSPTGRQTVQALKYAPIIINWDEQDADQPLAYIRRGQRGLGDHALTIFRTPASMVFDQSHIFFDGVWGVALSEIITGEAISWAAYFSHLKIPQPARNRPDALALVCEPALDKFSTHLPPEISAEQSGVNTKNLYRLLKLLPKRDANLKLTVNDLLILYRCHFSHEYQPSAALREALAELQAEDTTEATKLYHLVSQVLDSFQSGNPALMIPMNAIAAKPRERLYPTTFRNPLSELWADYKETWRNLSRYTVSQTTRHWADFTSSRHSLLVQVNYFGQLMRAYKKVALSGGSFNTATMKLLARVPPPLLELLHEIPQRVDILNEMVKGEEVFSNVGRVARESSLTRFISAKYDSDNKALSWGVLTDDADIMHISLREFRPYIVTLREAERLDLAEMMLEDYLNAFVVGFNQFVASLIDILNAQATHISGGEDAHEK